MQRTDQQALSLATEAPPRLINRPAMTVLGLALAMRLMVIWTVVTQYPPQWLFTRGMEMGLLAKSLLAGKGLSSPFGGETGPTAIVAPIYPLLVAAVFRVFGEYSTASIIFILAAQTILNLITIWLIMHVARRLFSQTAATLAGLIWACSLPLVWMPTILWETSLSCCLLAGLFALVLKYKAVGHPGSTQWVTLGAYCGVAALVNPALFPSLISVALWLAYVTRRQRTYKPLLSALAFVLVFAPWPIRNARVFHAFIPTRTTVGFELWMGNHTGATGFLDESLFPTFNRDELADYLRRGEVGYSAHKADLATTYIVAHPGEFIALTAKRFVRFWGGTGTSHGSWLFALHATVTTVFGVFALGLLIRKKRYDIGALFALPLLFFPLPYIITHAEFRYRLVIDPIVVIAGSYAMAELWSLIARSKHSTVSSSDLPEKMVAWRPI